MPFDCKKTYTEMTAVKKKPMDQVQKFREAVLADRGYLHPLVPLKVQRASGRNPNGKATIAIDDKMAKDLLDAMLKKKQIGVMIIVADQEFLSSL